MIDGVSYNSHRLSVAPMMDWTDRHCRYFLRLLSRRVLLYTGMVSADAILHGDRARLLEFSPEEQPLVLQLGGENPERLAEAARIGETYGYFEINLNAGCPSPRVQDGRFGASLMKRPDHVARIVEAIKARVKVPVTVKHRIGVDEMDSYEALENFVSILAASGCDGFIIHARHAKLGNLSPRQNREKPSLRYEMVRRLKQTLPNLRIEINGGLQNLDQALEHLQYVDGAMIGRAAYHNPYLFADADRRVFGEHENRPPTREEVVEGLISYAERLRAEYVPVAHLTRHVHGLFHGVPRARIWRRYLSENAWKKDAGPAVLREALLRTRLALEQKVDASEDGATPAADTSETREA